MPGRSYIGTSGFAYPEWKGDFYPADIRSDAMLRFYASRLTSVEINYTFQRTASEKTLGRWIADTPEGFTFSLKAHRSITHIRRLGPECEEPLEEFLQSMSPLGGRLGAILFQCPPTMKADVAVLRDFMARLPAGRRFAFEFRHESWHDEAVKRALAERGAAWCVVDGDELEAPFEHTASFAYLRLRKALYDDDALARWAKDITASTEDGLDVYCYFRHEAEGRGASYARRLQDILGPE